MTTTQPKLGATVTIGSGSKRYTVTGYLRFAPGEGLDTHALLWPMRGYTNASAAFDRLRLIDQRIPAPTLVVIDEYGTHEQAS